MSQTTITPYLFFGGRCQEALEFYREALGAEIGPIMLFSQSPSPVPEGFLPPGFEEKIMHASFKVSGAEVFASDGNVLGAAFSGFRLSLTSPTKEETEAAFTQLAAEGSVDMPLGPSFFSPLFGMVTDKFGVEWMVIAQSQAPKVKIEKSVTITASRDKIWDTVIGPETYKDWTSAFCEGSSFVGDWSEGSTMRFIGPDPEGGEGGMICRIISHEPGSHLRAEHYGVIAKGVEVYEGPIYEEWIPSVEEYWLESSGTDWTFRIATDVPHSYVEFFSGAWDKALARVKEIAEAS